MTTLCFVISGDDTPFTEVESPAIPPVGAKMSIAERGTPKYEQYVVESVAWRVTGLPKLVVFVFVRPL